MVKYMLMLMNAIPMMPPPMNDMKALVDNKVGIKMNVLSNPSNLHSIRKLTPMLVTDIGEKMCYKVLATILAILATNIHSHLVNVKRRALTLK